MDKKNRTWLIIGVDILLVILVYMVYVHFLAPALKGSRDGTFEVQTNHQQIVYSLRARPNGENNLMELEFSLHNTGSDTRTVLLPNGITLLLSDGKQYVYDREKVFSRGRLSISPGNRESWEHEASYPQLENDKIYAAYYLDDQRQKRLPVQVSR